MKLLPYFLVFIFSFALINCTPTEKENQDDSTTTNQAIFSKTLDTHSYARPQEAVTKHLNLNLEVDFFEKKLKGFAQWDIQNNNSKRIFFDCGNLNIQKVTIGKEEKETTYRVSSPKEIKGAVLSIDIEPTTEFLTIYYETAPDNAAALDWIDASLTADKKHPALFTQGQAILTRTWIPCQDSPGIRITYDAEINVPSGMLAVMSASNPQKKNDSGVYQFKMEQPIPSYLIALAVGDLEFKAIGEKTGVYAEPSVIDKAAYEFEEMDKMLTIAEKMYGPYAWDRYDVIVLPPSFPFGGMENPRLTFATPTIIAGDRSLVALIAHELAHSWSGNLVTNATWDDFWLNEGFTVYFERRIMEELAGKPYRDMLAVLGLQDLEADMADLSEADTHLKLDLKGRDPDDGMTNVAYEKGAFFLEMIEYRVGREKFDAFLTKYFEQNKFKTLTTEDFITYLNEYLIDPEGISINLEEWIYGPGLPESMPEVKSDRFEMVDQAITDFGNKMPLDKLNTGEWTTHEWLHFIRNLKPANAVSLSKMDNHFKFKESGNAEILAAWFVLGIKSGYGPMIIENIDSFLTSVGRRKFLTPLYRAMKENDMMADAQRIYKKARPNYHSVSKGTMDKLLDYKDQ